jgi:hypothetical protein
LAELAVRPRPVFLCALLVSAALVAPHAQTTRGLNADERWVTAWATAQQLAPTRVAFGGREQPPPPPVQARIPVTLANQTIRMNRF